MRGGPLQCETNHIFGAKTPVNMTPLNMGPQSWVS